MPNYEPIYSLTAKLQDMQSRQHILNKRHKIVEELYSILTDELNVKLSNKLEPIKKSFNSNRGDTRFNNSIATVIF